MASCNPNYSRNTYGGLLISISITTKFEKFPTFRKPWSYKNWMLIADVFSINIPYLHGTGASGAEPLDVLQ